MAAIAHPTPETFRPEAPSGVQFPLAPRDRAALNLPRGVIADLAVKVLQVRGLMTGAELADHLRIPFDVLRDDLHELSDQGHCASRGMNMRSAHPIQDVEATYAWELSRDGRRRAQDLMEVDRYSGPAPVSIDDYRAAAPMQAPGSQGSITASSLRAALSHLVLADETLDGLGPALNGRHSIFLYGPPGNGKTTIVDACIGLLGGAVYVPHALFVEGEVVRLFDPIHHRRVLAGLPTGHDRRWVCIERPHVKVGGELAPHSLELAFDRRLGYFESALQIKANSGILTIDDFGRQSRITPAEILNRFIVPLESRVDYFALARAGTTVSVPFTALLVLATNLAPEDLVDEAFFRRVHAKVRIPDPTEDAYREIWRRACAGRGIRTDERAIDRLIDIHYRKAGRTLRGVHPRDLMAQLVGVAQYRQVPPRLSDDLIDQACRLYFVTPAR